MRSAKCIWRTRRRCGSGHHNVNHASTGTCGSYNNRYNKPGARCGAVQDQTSAGIRTGSWCFYRSCVPLLSVCKPLIVVRHTVITLLWSSVFRTRPIFRDEDHTRTSTHASRGIRRRRFGGRVQLQRVLTSSARRVTVPNPAQHPVTLIHTILDTRYTHDTRYSIHARYTIDTYATALQPSFSFSSFSDFCTLLTLLTVSSDKCPSDAVGAPCESPPPPGSPTASADGRTRNTGTPVVPTPRTRARGGRTPRRVLTRARRKLRSHARGWLSTVVQLWPVRQSASSSCRVVVSSRVVEGLETCV
ncbi:hypothetical protein GY45DRAFT_766294 [Cubamyces sp. BRFM 1775]|nr:hypothetical protein GY45DRAFT_766294 [Cubamyces sp. BRFM 1775]